jgi:hypothetical protein
MNRSKSLPSKLNTYIKQSFISYHDFNNLFLNGEQKLISYGSYCNNKESKKEIRKKMITYFYKKLISKL